MNLCRDPARLAFAPRPRLRPSEWCDQEIVVTAGQLVGARWRTTAAQRGILDIFHVEPMIETVVVKSAAQVGKSASATGMVAFYLAHRPTAILYVTATKDPDAYTWSRTRFEPVVRASPALRAVMHEPYARELGAAAKVMLRTARNGAVLAIAGANSASSLASRSTEVLIQDEVDRWPDVLGSEGSPIDISRARTDAYGSDRKVLMLSTPTTDAAPITVWHRDGDQRRWFVPCPECGCFQPLEWEHFDFDGGDGEPVLRCVECDHGITDSERRRILEDGEWRATEEPSDPTIASFHLSRFDSPFSSLRDIVRSFKLARRKQKRGDPDAMTAWVNLWRGLEVAANVEKVDPDRLLARREVFEHEAPAGVDVLTAGVDIQGDRIEVLVVGWGDGEESWILRRAILYGDPTTDVPWEQLAEELDATYQNPAGEHFGIRMMGVDAGYLPSRVYQWVGKRQPRGVRAVIGRAGVYPIISSPSAPRGDRPCALHKVGDDESKTLILARLKVKPPGPGTVHLPAEDWCDSGFMKSLASEALETTMVRGRPVQRWRVLHRRNEVLDTFKYALAVRRLFGPAKRKRTTPKEKPRAPWAPARRDWMSR